MKVAFWQHHDSVCISQSFNSFSHFSMWKSYVHSELRNKLLILPKCSLGVLWRTRGRETDGKVRRKVSSKAYNCFHLIPLPSMGGQSRMRALSCGISCSVEGMECLLARLFLKAQMLPNFRIQRRIQHWLWGLRSSSETVFWNSFNQKIPP